MRHKLREKETRYLRRLWSRIRAKVLTLLLLDWTPLMRTINAPIELLVVYGQPLFIERAHVDRRPKIAAAAG